MSIPRIGASASLVVAALCGAVMTAAPRPAQAPAAIDFARDVQPILKERCYRCHGPDEQKNGYRVDRRSRAYGGVVRTNIIPGSSVTSRLYQRVAGTAMGTRMPPDEPLAAEQIGVLQAWIDQGADWPDGLANETDWPAPDPRATRLNEAIRAGDANVIDALLAQDAKVSDAAAADGSTPLMYAALYGSVPLLERLLSMGANPNARNHAGATALMRALDDVEKVRILLRRGADPNAVSDLQRTPLLMAAGQNMGAPVVKALLDAGAEARQPALTAAAGSGNDESVRLLLAAGVVDNGDATAAALRANCKKCVDIILAAQPTLPLKNALRTLLPPLGSGETAAIRVALDRGADVHITGPLSATPLMRLAIADSAGAEGMKLLLDHGADRALRSAEGKTALDYAARLGHTSVVALLARSPVVAPSPGPATPGPSLKGNSADAAVRRSLPLLQRSGVRFYEMGGCVSCHSNLLTAMTVATARASRLPVDDGLAAREATTLAKDVATARELGLQGLVMAGGGPTTTGYVLMGLAAQGHRRDEGTDALVRLLRRAQRPDGRWQTAYRPPSEASDFTAAAVCLRGIQLFGADSADDRRAIDAAVSWLATATPRTTEDRVFRLFGLAWGRAAPETLQPAIADLVRTQRPDGGWAQLDSLPSDAYATGSALTALADAGTSPSASVYRKGVAFLLRTQLPDGSWHVGKRAFPTQTYFDSGFPHGADQYISAAATNWATMALIRSRPAGRSSF